MNVSDFTCKNRSAFALIGYCFFWLMEDRFLQDQVRDGKLSKENVSLIARAYSFDRTIPKGMKDKIACAINALAYEWPAGKIAWRAKACLDRIHGNGSALKGIYSGTSKLIWFLRPEGWIPFDRFAATATCSVGTTTAVRMQNFYEIAEKRLPKAICGISKTVENIHPGIRPERVVDQYLMLWGMPEEEWARRRSRFKAFASGLPNGCHHRLAEASSEVGAALERAWPLAAQKTEQDIPPDGQDVPQH